MTRVDAPGPAVPVASVSNKQLSIALVIPCTVCFFLVFTSTVNAFPEIPVYDSKRFAEFVLFAVVFVIALAVPSLRREVQIQVARIPKAVAAGILVFFALGILSAVTNAESTRGLTYSLVDVLVLTLVGLLAIVVAASRNLSGRQFDRIVICFLAFLGLAVGVQEIVGFLALWSLGTTFSFEVSLINFSFPRMYNHLQTLTIPILPALPLLFSRNRLAPAACITALGLQWHILLVTGARGSIVSLVVALSIASILSATLRKSMLFWQGAGLALGIMIYAALYLGSELGNPAAEGTDAAATVQQQQDQPSPGKIDAGEANTFFDQSVGRPLLHTTGRTKLWRSAATYAADHWLLGIGPMNYACKGPVGRVGSPHNIVMQIMSEWGVPAAALLVAFGAFLFWRLLRGFRSLTKPSDSDDALKGLLATALLAAMVHLMVSSLLIPPASQVTMALVGGWLLAFGGSGRKPGGNTARVILPLALLCSLLLVAFGHHELNYMPGYASQSPPIELERPRLWQLGKACSSSIEG